MMKNEKTSHSLTAQEMRELTYELIRIWETINLITKGLDCLPDSKKINDVDDSNSQYLANRRLIGSMVDVLNYVVEDLDHVIFLLQKDREEI